MIASGGAAMLRVQAAALQGNPSLIGTDPVQPSIRSRIPFGWYWAWAVPGPALDWDHAESGEDGIAQPTPFTIGPVHPGAGIHLAQVTPIPEISP